MSLRVTFSLSDPRALEKTTPIGGTMDAVEAVGNSTSVVVACDDGERRRVVAEIPLKMFQHFSGIHEAVEQPMDISPPTIRLMVRGEYPVLAVS